MSEFQNPPPSGPPYGESRQPPRPPMVESAACLRPRRSGALWVLLILLILLILPSLIERVEYAITRGREQAEAEVAREVLSGDHPTSIADYRYVAKAVAPSVVGVKASRIVRGEPTDEQSYFIRRRPQFREQDQGSGVIVDPAGHIITNYHVVNGASDVNVELSDGSRHPAKIIGIDPLTDLAVLKIQASGLTATPWGDSDSLQVGDPVMAIGNPFGLASTVTAGIISAKGRRAVVENVNYQDFLQTDAAVNPGNSGGPLVNMKGEVIGINTAILGPTYQGISFAIPSALVRHVYDQLMSTGKVDRGWLGVSMQELTPELAEKLELKSTNGALVSGILPGAPAEQAGLQPGDVIIRWKDKAITDPIQLGFEVASTKIGEKAPVTVIRAGKELTLNVTVGQRPEPSPQ